MSDRCGNGRDGECKQGARERQDEPRLDPEPLKDLTPEEAAEQAVRGGASGVAVGCS